jgi:hypothetical protein
MDTGTVFVVSYFIQVPLAIYAAFFIPMRGELSTFFENGRRGIIVFGILPCAFFSVLNQVIYLAIYLVKVKSVEGQAVRAQARFNTSLGDAAPGSGGNPFGGVRAPGPSAEGNPFAGGSTRSPGPSGDNPFA